VHQLAALMPERFRVMVLVTAFCCLRFGEVTELRRDDFKDGKLHISRGVTRVDGKFVIGPPKTKAGVRSVPVLPSLKAPLAQQILTNADEDGLIFPAERGGNLSHASLMTAFRKARVALGKPTMSWHHLRHTGAVLWAQSPDINLTDLMALLGHETPDMALHYQHVVDGKLDDIAATLDHLMHGSDEEDAA
jgi:integrase